ACVGVAMRTVGIIGIGDMGSGVARNLLKAGFTLHGYDPAPQRMADFEAAGGVPCPSVAEVGIVADAVFVMVMNGAQAEQVILGEGGLRDTLQEGSIILLTATIKPGEARALGEGLEGSGIMLIDTPVSGGRPGADGGTLTLMAAGPATAMSAARPAMEAISGTIHHVGLEAGDGQTVKACLQSLIGSIFTGAFEATTLAAKAGVPGQVLFDVFSTSAAGCGITKAAVGNVMERKFEGTGSHINTMHKDLTIALDFARELGVPLFTAGTAMQLFEAGRTRYPDGDNQVVARIGEEIVGAELKQ
ncbi:MAG: NAD(P)-dependent oxidoreductase, partial [Pseudomonadota bacterium]